MSVRRIGPERESFADAFRQLVSYRSLLVTVAGRELRLRYKQTLLGIAWAVVHPLMLMLVLTFVFGRVIRLDSEGLPYSLFAYAALLPWTFVASGTTMSTQSLVKDVELVTRIWFPREILPFASVFASLVDFFVASLLFIALILFYGHGLSWTVIAVVPLVAIQMILVLGLALFNSAVNVRYRDVKYIVPLAVQVWMFASPVIYSISHVPERFRGLYALNPVVGLVDGFRSAVLHGRLPDWSLVGSSAAVSVAILMIGWWFFRRVEIFFADVI